ncbi:MAG: hypothetical protein ACQEQL_04015 [Pseudomonadota bacterium]
MAEAHKPEEPVFTAQRHFRAGLLVSRHPIRILVWALLLLFLFPELSWIVESIFSVSTDVADVLVFFITLMCFFGLPLLVYYIEYRWYPILFYKDRVNFLEHFILRNYHSIPYRNIMDIKVKASPLQKRYKLKSVWLNIRTKAASLKSRDYWIQIPDLQNASATALALRKLIDPDEEHEEDEDNNVTGRPNSV